MKKFHRKRIDRRIARFNRKLRKEHDRRIKMIERAVTYVNSFCHSYYDGHRLAFEDEWVAEIDQCSGELTRYLVRIPDSNTFHKIGWYLRAYRDTNMGVLSDEQMGELERIIQFF